MENQLETNDSIINYYYSEMMKLRLERHARIIRLCSFSNGTFIVVHF